MIAPTVGRKVWYRPSDADIATHGMVAIGDQPLDATIVGVWNDACINLVVFDANGKQHVRLSAFLWQDGDMPNGAYAEFMPFQVKQADKGVTYADTLVTCGLTATTITSGTVELGTEAAKTGNW